jgi:hypothetical protein
MKKLILIILCCCVNAIAFAQAQTDSLAYQLERKKINSMLAQRRQKFGQYDQSLTMHTGIFGFQTKKDIRRSNDILMDIVKTDDAIYLEIKILLDFRAFQQSQVQNHSKEAEQSNLGYMTTINKLRNQVDQLKAESDKQQEQAAKTRNIFIVLLIILLGAIIYLLARKKTPVV